MRLNVKSFVDKQFPPNRSSRTRNANINQFAKAIGVSIGAAQKIYDAETTRIDFNTLETICRVLECTPNDIIISDDPTVSRLLLYVDKMQRDKQNDKEKDGSE